MPERLARVLMTADAIGGVWTFALELATGLSAAGIETLLAVMGGGFTPVKRADAEAIPGLRVVASDFRLEWMPDCWEDVQSAGTWLLELEKEFAPQIVHVNGYAHAALPWNAAVVVTAHSDVLSWFRAVRGEDGPAEWNRYRSAVRKGLQSADCIVAPTRASFGDLAAHYGWFERAEVIHNGLTAPPFSQHATQADKEPFILTAGRFWDDAKNLRVLSAAAQQVQWPIFCAGDAGPQDPGNGLRLLGNLSRLELARFYERAAIYALPALYEPFGYTALEAACHGCALVLSDLPTLREVWNHCAVFVPPYDAVAWARELNALSNEEARRTILAHEAWLRAQQFSSSKMTARYLDAYQKAQNRLQCESRSSLTRSDQTGITGTHTFSGAL